jgi:phosphoglycolate phosphatase
VLTLAGIPDPGRHIAAFQAVMAAHAPELADVIRSGGTALPGAIQALAALAAAGGNGAGGVIQALLTGNIRALAEVKLGALGLTSHLDLDVGAYGDVHEVRSELVGPARRQAALAYGADFSGEATILVGDTPLDIEAALVTGARAVGVATGHFSVADLTAAGAHAVLPDLTDTGRVLAAVLGSPR